MKSSGAAAPSKTPPPLDAGRSRNRSGTPSSRSRGGVGAAPHGPSAQEAAAAIKVPTLGEQLAARKAKKGNQLGLPAVSAHMTNHEFRSAVEQLVKVLSSDESVSWERRVESLAKFSQLIATEHCADRACFVEVVGSYAVKRAICAQLQDLRSAVVREASKWVRTLCTSCLQRSDLWAALCDAYVPMLLTCRGSSTAAIANTAEESIQMIVERGTMTRPLLQHFLSACSGKNPALRCCCFRYLAVLLCRCETSAVQRYYDGIAATVREGLSDAGEESRKFARYCFWVLHLVNGDEALRLYEPLTEGIQRKLDEAKTEFLAFHAEHHYESQAARALENAAAVGGGGGGTRGGLSGGQESSDTTAAAPTGSSGTNAETGEQRAAATSERATPQQTSRAAPVRTMSPKSPRATPRPSTYTEFMQRKELGTAKANTGATPKGRSGGVVVGATRSAAMIGDSPLTRALRDKDRGALQELWHQTLSDIQGTDWSLRESGLQRLVVTIDHLYRQGEHLEKNQIQEVFKLLPFRLADPHYRVALAAMDAFDCVLANLPAQTLEELQQLLVVLFTQAVHNSKDIIRSAARKELKTLSELFDADVLLGPIYRVLDQSSQQMKVKVSALEFLLFLVQKATKVFTPLLIKNTLGRLLHHFQRERAPPTANGLTAASSFSLTGSEKTSTSEVLHAIGSCLGALYQLAPDAFVRCVLLLPSADQLAAISACEKMIPHLQQDCRRMAAGERLLQHPDVVVASPFAKALRELQQPSQKTPQRSAGVGQRSEAKREVTQLRNSATKSPGSLFQDVSIMATTAPNGGAAAGQHTSSSPPSGQRTAVHYDPVTFSATSSKQADAVHQTLIRNASSPQQSYTNGSSSSRWQQESGANSSPPSQNRKQLEDVRALVANRIYDAINEHRLPPDVVLNLRGAGDGDSRADAMLAAAAAVSDRCQVWIEHFTELIAFAFALSADPTHRARLAAVKCIENVVKHPQLSALATKVLPMALDTVLRCTEDPFAEVRGEAAVVFHLICSGGFFLKEDVLMGLISCCAKRTACSPSLLQALEELGALVWRAVSRDGQPKGEASTVWLSDAALTKLTAMMVDYFNHETSEVRKTVVGSLVLVWAALDTRAVRLLKPLTMSQRKLVSIYYGRVMMEHCDEGGVVAGFDPTTCNRDLGAEIDRSCVVARPS